MQMTLQDRDQLLEALRGGQYPQGMYSLERRGIFCCLGVISALLHQSIGLKRWERKDGLIAYYSTEHVKEDGYSTAIDLHQRLAEKLNCAKQGFAVPKQFFDEGELVKLNYDEVAFGGRVHAISLNDTGFTFTRIAELAEKVIVVIDNYEDRNVVFDPNPPRPSEATS